MRNCSGHSSRASATEMPGSTLDSSCEEESRARLPLAGRGLTRVLVDTDAVDDTLERKAHERDRIPALGWELTVDRQHRDAVDRRPDEECLAARILATHRAGLL